MRSILPLLCALLVIFQACGKNEPSVPPQEPKQIIVEQDESFSTPEKIEAWKEEVVLLASSYPQVRDLHSTLTPLSFFTFDETSLQTLIGPDLYRVSPQNPFLHPYADEDWCTGEQRLQDRDNVGTLTEAQKLEADDEEWRASRIYQHLKRTDDARRCMLALKGEGEWAAAGRLAVELGDFDTLNETVDAFRASNQTTKIRELVHYAIQLNHAGTAKHIVQRMEWKLYDAQWETLTWAITCGVEDLVPDILPDFITDFMDADGLPRGREHLLLAYVVLQAKTDKEKAVGYARTLLGNPRLNVVASVSCGEGCDITPAIGTVEFWNLIRHDEEMKTAYLDRIQDWFAPFVLDATHPVWTESATVYGGPYTSDLLVWDISYPARTHLLWNLLRAVAQNGDPKLHATYLAILEQDTWAQPPPINPMEREVGRKILTGTWKLDAPDLTQGDRHVLSLLAGERAQADLKNQNEIYPCCSPGFDFVFKDGSILYGYTLDALYSAGHLSQEDILRLWKELGIETAVYDGPVYPQEEQAAQTDKAREYLTQGDIEEAVQICRGLLRSSEKNLCGMEGLTTRTPEESGYLYDLISRGQNLHDGQMAIYHASVDLAKEDVTVVGEWHMEMSELLQKPRETRRDNLRLRDSLPESQHAQVTNFPDADALVQEVMPEVIKANPAFAKDGI